MKTKFLYLASLITAAVYADAPMTQETPPQKEVNKCYLKLGSGASFSTKADISAPFPVWDLSNQGYDSSLGTRPVVEGGIGYEFLPQLSADITFAYRPHYTYKKYQTSPSNNSLGALGTKTRRFNMDIASALLTVYLSGRDVKYLCWNWKSISSKIYPIVGGGVGVNQITIYNFRSTGLAALPSNAPLLSFSTENQYDVSYRFGYQILAGLEFRYRDRWAISMGYRWFDPNKIKGPRYFRDAEGGALDVGSDTMDIDFSANELFVDLKVLF